MTTYKRGQVVLVPFPFTDLSSVKQRPALIISSDARNATRPDVVLLAITSQVSASPACDEYAVPAAELATWGLPKASMVKLSKIFAMHQGLIRKPLGSVPAATLTKILRQVQELFEP